MARTHGLCSLIGEERSQSNGWGAGVRTPITRSRAERNTIIRRPNWLAAGKITRLALRLTGQIPRPGPSAGPARRQPRPPALALRITVDGKTVTYSGDGGWSDGWTASAKGADLFIAECYYYDKKVPYHMNLETLTEYLDEIAPKRLILTHMSEDMLARVESLNLETAEDGKIVEI